MMRFVLYEGDRTTIPLAKEVDFLRHYVALMQMRYPERVQIELTLPEGDISGEVPPLVFASFVENAFMHGVSYEYVSFVRMSVALQDGKTVFRCTNSRHGGGQVEGLGIGLQNVRRRLDLLYGNRYTLLIDKNDVTYDVVLTLPQATEIQEDRI